MSVIADRDDPKERRFAIADPIKRPSQFNRRKRSFSLTEVRQFSSQPLYYLRYLLFLIRTHVSAKAPEKPSLPVSDNAWARAMQFQ
jgi:hypothetical protein